MAPSDSPRQPAPVPWAEAPESPLESSLDCVAVALDTDDLDTFRRWAELVGPRVGWLKVGLQAFVRHGPAVVEVARRANPRIFLDLKLHDIPNTVAGAVAAVADLGVSLVTIHAGGGPAMMGAAVEAAAGGAGARPVGILAVTVLTHLDAGQLEALDLPGSAADRVSRWARSARSEGCAGVVCSPLEVERLRREHPRPFRLVTPGIRPAGARGGGGDDQRRTATPAAEQRAKWGLLVIGRPITAAADPGAALDALETELRARPAG